MKPKLAHARIAVPNGRTPLKKKKPEQAPAKAAPRKPQSATVINMTPNRKPPTASAKRPAPVPPVTAKRVRPNSSSPAAKRPERRGKDLDDADFAPVNETRSKPSPAKGRALTVSTSRNVPALAENPRKPKISKTDLANLDSIVGDKVEVIQDMLEQGNFESATNAMHKVLLQTLVDVLPFAEQAIRKTEGAKGVYQINSLVSMILETLSSARSQADRGALAEHILERTVKPVFKGIAEALVREFMALSADLSTARPNDVESIVRETRNRLATSVQSSYETLRSELVASMSG